MSLTNPLKLLVGKPPEGGTLLFTRTEIFLFSYSSPFEIRGAPAVFMSGLSFLSSFAMMAAERSSP